MTDPTFDALRAAHDMYLNALGQHIVTLERVSEVFGVDLTAEVGGLREARATAELQCRQLELTLAGRA